MGQNLFEKSQAVEKCDSEITIEPWPPFCMKYDLDLG